MGANASTSNNNNGSGNGSGPVIMLQPPDLAPRFPPHNSGGSAHPSLLLDGAAVTSPVLSTNQKTPSKRKTNSNQSSGGSLFTLRKRLLIKGRRRASKIYDHGQIFHDFLCEWSPRDVAALVREFEASAALRELIQQADNARPLATSCRKDLGALFESKVCADITLVYRGQSFPTHRAILSVRCPFFRELLSDPVTLGSQIVVEIDIPGVHVDLFNDLLRYLYTGELAVSSSNNNGAAYEGSLTTLVQLSEQFGIPNPLEQDLRHLLDAEIFSDALLVFSSEAPRSSTLGTGQCGPTSGEYTGSEYCRWCTTHQPQLSGSSGYDVTSGCGGTGSAHNTTSGSASAAGNNQQNGGGSFSTSVVEFPCHRALLAARSPFLKSVILRQQRRFAEQGGPYSTRAAFHQQTTRITLDRNVIPQRFAKLLLASLYQDNVDFSALLTPLSTTGNGSGNKDGGYGNGGDGDGTGAQQRHFVRELTELYQVSQLVEVDSLTSKDCENVIAELLSVETLPTILSWSEQPHGSSWVYRQSIAYIRDEFSAIANSSVLYQLTEKQLMQVLKSDYVQASELEILGAVVKWGEHNFLKRLEERDPSAFNAGANSGGGSGIARSKSSSSAGVASLSSSRRKELIDDQELGEMLSKLLALVRTDHVLPPQSEVLMQAVKRNLVRNPTAISGYVPGDDSCLGMSISTRRARAWVRGRNSCCGLYVKPRLFMPYVEAAKQFLENSPEARHYHHSISSCAYYTPSSPYGTGNNNGTSLAYPDNLYMVEPGYGGRADHLGGSTPGLLNADPSDTTSEERSITPSDSTALLVAPNEETLRRLKRRENELKSCQTACRAYALVANRCDVTRQIQLRVVREEGLPDGTVDALARFTDTHHHHHQQQQQQQQPQQQQSHHNRASSSSSGDFVSGSLYHHHSSLHPSAAAELSRRTSVLSTFGTLRNRHYSASASSSSAHTSSSSSATSAPPPTSLSLGPNNSVGLSLVYGPASTRYSGTVSSPTGGTGLSTLTPAQRMNRAERLYGTISRSSALTGESAAWFVERTGAYRGLSGSSSQQQQQPTPSQQQQSSSLRHVTSSQGSVVPPPLSYASPSLSLHTAHAQQQQGGLSAHAHNSHHHQHHHPSPSRALSVYGTMRGGERKTKMAAASLRLGEMHRSQETHLSDIIPDIAMASSSMLEHLSVSAEKDPPNVLL